MIAAAYIRGTPQSLVPEAASRPRPRLVDVIGLGSDRQQGTDRLDPPYQTLGLAVPVLIDEGDHRLGWRSSNAPKKAAAAFKISSARRSSDSPAPTPPPWTAPQG